MATTEALKTPAATAGTAPLLKVRGLEAWYGESHVLHGISLAVEPGEIRWDWPLYEQIGAAMKAAAKDLGVPIVWGGDWASFRDGPHFELDRTACP